MCQLLPATAARVAVLVRWGRRRGNPLPARRWPGGDLRISPCSPASVFAMRQRRIASTYGTSLSSSHACHLAWRWVFLVNVTVAAVALLASPRMLPAAPVS